MTKYKVGNDVKVTEVTPGCQVKMLQIVLDNAEADDGDTVTLNLKNYGCSKIMGIVGYQLTTEGSVVAEEAPTTDVTNGVLEITIGGSDDDLKRSFLIWAY